MTKLNYKPSSITKSIVPSIDSAVTELVTAANKCDAMSVPSGFSYATYLRNLKTTINGYKSNLDAIKFWLNKCNNKYRDCMSDINANITAISDLEITKRESYIKTVK